MLLLEPRLLSSDWTVTDSDGDSTFLFDPITAANSVSLYGAEISRYRELPDSRTEDLPLSFRNKSQLFYVAVASFRAVALNVIGGF